MTQTITLGIIFAAAILIGVIIFLLARREIAKGFNKK